MSLLRKLTRVSNYAITFVLISCNNVKYQLVMLKHRPRLLRAKYKKPKDEFDPCLDLDLHAMIDMNEKETRHYMTDILRRRRREHKGHRAHT